MVHSAQTVHLSCIKISAISKRTEQASTWASSPSSTIVCIQNDFWAYGTFGVSRAPILCQDSHHLQTDRNELPLERRHLGVPSSASKMISKPNVCLMQMVHLSCIRGDQNEIPHGACYVGVLSGASKMISEPMVRWAQTCTYLAERLALSPNGPKSASSWAS
jgi:hypothetical protein